MTDKQPEKISALEQPRLEPPKDLTETQTWIWVDLLKCFPSDYFNQSDAPLLTEYCRAVDAANKVAASIAAFQTSYRPDDPEFITGFEKLLKMQDKQARLISHIAQKCRFTKHSLSNHRGNASPFTGSTGEEPWNFGNSV